MSFDALKSRVSAYVENNFPDINGGSGGGESDGSGSKAGVGLEALVFLYVAMVYESGRTPEPLHLEVTSKIPVGAGLGSSARRHTASTHTHTHALVQTNLYIYLRTLINYSGLRRLLANLYCSSPTTYDSRDLGLYTERH